MGKIGLTEILLILVVVVLLFGGRKIPELMKGIGQGMKEFKKASKYDPADEKKKWHTKTKSDIKIFPENLQRCRFFC